MQSRRQPTRSIKRAPRILGGLIGLFVVALLVNAWIRASDDPVINIPKPVLPTPNAYDFYVFAGKAILTAKHLSDAKMRIPFVGSRTVEQEKVLEQMEAELQQNASAFQKLHQGFAYEYCPPDTRTANPSMNAHAGFRNMAHVLFAQSRVRAARGDWSGAMDSALDGIQLGEEIEHHGDLIDNLVGCVCEAIGQRPMWETIGYLNASQSRAAAQRLQFIIDRRFPYADTMQEEKWHGQAMLMLIFQGITVRDAFSMKGGLLPDHPSPVQRWQYAGALLYGKKRMMRDFTVYVDKISQLARQPYGLHLPSPPPPPDAITNMMLAAYKDARLHQVGTDTQNGFLLVMLALHVFQLEQGHYPASLAELTPAYLKKLPDDPFAAQGGFQYRIRGASYVLYSVGPDGKDDGGIPINDPKYVGVLGTTLRYNVKSGTLGDIVAGINFP